MPEANRLVTAAGRQGEDVASIGLESDIHGRIDTGGR